MTRVFRSVILLMMMWTQAQVTAAERPAVVLTTDCGTEVDDQWALAHLALSSELDLEGIVTTHAPNLAAPAAETSARMARKLLDQMPLKSQPPVLPGSSRPLASKTEPLSNAGVDFLLRRARDRSPERRLIVVVIGAATDVASALLTDPGLADRIQIVAMGFDAWPEGKDPWNVKNDVKAWQVLLESRAPIVIGDSAVTRRHLTMTNNNVHDLLADRGEAGPVLLQQWDAWYANHGKAAESAPSGPIGWPIWDEVTVACLLGLTESKIYPRPVLRDDLTFDHTRPSGTVVWVTSIDAPRLWHDLRQKLGPRRNAR